MMETSIRIDASRLETFLQRVPNMANRLMRRFKREAGEIVQGAMVRRAPFDRGFLSMMILVDESIQDAVFVESTASYSKYVVRGTGLFGPTGRRIFPRVAEALRFKIGGKVVFARSIAGMRANPFIRETRDAAVPRVAELVQRIVTEVYR